MSGVLRGLRVVVARPRDQAGELLRLLQREDAQAHSLPAIRIKPVAASEQLRAEAEQLDRAEIVVFISANAVTHGLDLLQHLGKQWPKDVKVAAVGSATARALGDRGLAIDVVPRRPYNSEALLATPLLQEPLHGLAIVVFRGVGGRELLAETLRRRGAEVVYIEVYRRLLPAISNAEYRRRFVLLKPHLVVLTSAAVVKNYLRLMDFSREESLHPDTQFLLTSPRQVDCLREILPGVTPLVSPDATNEMIVNTIKIWYGAL